MDKRYDKNDPLADPPYSSMSESDKAQARADKAALDGRTSRTGPTSTPAVGDIVLFQPVAATDGNASTQPLAAIVTKVDGSNSTYGLCIFLPGACRFDGAVPYSASLKAGHWSPKHKA